MPMSKNNRNKAVYHPLHAFKYMAELCSLLSIDITAMFVLCATRMAILINQSMKTH